MPIGRRFHMNAFGCQMNVLDAEVVEGELLRAGFTRAAAEADADVVLFHTCSVREQSEHRVWSRLGQLRERRHDEPGMRVVVLGCMAQRDGREIVRRMPHVDAVVGTRRFPEIAALLARTAEGDRVLAIDEVECLPPPRHLSARPDPWRAFVTAMRGCDHACTFCIVPTVRGPQVSVPFDALVREVEALVADGVVEVTLLGQNIDSYGRDLPGAPTLADLIRRLDRVAGLRRLRFITSHPGDITLDLIDAMAECATAMPYLAMPAQSGSDAVLRRMARQYTAARYREIVVAARARLPRLDLCTDWIVGVPRPGTPSAGHFPDDVPDAVKLARNHALLEAQERVSALRNAARIGDTVEVLVDGPSRTNPSRVSGRTPEHRLAVFDGDASLTGRIVPVRVLDATAATLYAERVGMPAASGAGRA